MLLALMAVSSALAKFANADPLGRSIQEDPTTAPVPAPSAFRKCLDDAEYAKRSAALNKPVAAGAPFAGALIDTVNDGSAAAALGLKAQDIVCDLGGHPLSSNTEFQTFREIDSAQTMKVWSPATSAYRSV